MHSSEYEAVLGVDVTLYEWQLSYAKVLFSFMHKLVCGFFLWYVWVWGFSCLWELVVYQTSQQSKQNLNSSDNDFGIDCLFDWAMVFL